MAGLLALGAVVSWSGAAWQHFETRRLQAELEKAKAAQAEQARLRSLPLKASEPPWAPSAREMLDHARSPWPEALTALESVAKVGVTPVAVGIDVPARKVVVELEFDDYAALLDYLAQLNAGESPMRWSLMQTQSPDRSPGVGANVARSKSTATIGAALPPPASQSHADLAAPRSAAVAERRTAAPRSHEAGGGTNEKDEPEGHQE